MSAPVGNTPRSYFCPDVELFNGMDPLDLHLAAKATPEAVADKALYKAKGSGRKRVVMA